MPKGVYLALAYATASVLALPGFAQDAGSRSIWDGVYTEEQAERGDVFYSGVCAKCHGRTGNGAGDPDQPKSPAVARASFLGKWEGRSLADLFDYVRTTMPYDNPGSRSDEEMIDAIAHMLALSDVPAGEIELPVDTQALSDIEILVQEP